MPKIKVKPRGIVTQHEVERMLQRAENPMHRAYIAMLYVFGFRVSEFCGNHKKEIHPMRKGIEVSIYIDQSTNLEVIKVVHRALKKRTKGGVLDLNQIILATSTWKTIPAMTSGSGLKPIFPNRLPGTLGIVKVISGTVTNGNYGVVSSGVPGTISISDITVNWIA